MTPVQGHREPFRFDVDAGGRLGPGPIHQGGDHRLPGPGVRTNVAQAVQADERHAGGRAQGFVQKVRRPPGDHGDEGELVGQTGQQRGDTRPRSRPHGVGHNGRKSAVEVEAEGAVARILCEREQDLGEGTHCGRWITWQAGRDRPRRPPPRRPR